MLVHAAALAMLATTVSHAAPGLREDTIRGVGGWILGGGTARAGGALCVASRTGPAGRTVSVAVRDRLGPDLLELTIVIDDPAHRPASRPVADGELRLSLAGPRAAGVAYPAKLSFAGRAVAVVLPLRDELLAALAATRAVELRWSSDAVGARTPGLAPALLALRGCLGEVRADGH